MTHSFGFHEERFFSEHSWICFVGKCYLLPKPSSLLFTPQCGVCLPHGLHRQLCEDGVHICLVNLGFLNLLSGARYYIQTWAITHVDHWRFHMIQPSRFFIKVCWIKTSIQKSFLSVWGCSWTAPLQPPNHGSCKDDMGEEPLARNHLFFW